MRIVLSIILLSCLTLSASSTPTIRTGALPGWLMPVQPDRTREPSTEEISDGYYYELQDLQTNLPLRTEYFHLIRHIVNGSGVQDASEVSVTFSPQYQEVVFHRIFILRDGVTLDRLQPERIKVVQEESDAGDYEYNGQKRAFLTLTDVRKGDRIEIAYSVIGFNPVFGDKYSTQQYFTRSTAICNYFRTIISSPGRPLRFLSHNNAVLPQESLEGDRLVYRWSNPPLKDEDETAGAPSWYEPAPFVGITEYKDWQEVVGWGLRTFDRYRYPLPAALLKKMAEWRKAAAGNQDLFANLATRFVQNDIRYLGLEMGENSHRPHAPAEVFVNRYGDCKDKSLLLSCILRQEGIPAYATLISTTGGATLPQCAPSPGLFNHVIVAISRPGGNWLYVDPTLTGQRGELSQLYTPAYGYTLMLRDGEDSLRTVVPVQNCNYTIREDLDARYDDTSRLKVSTVFTGGAADKIRRAFEDNSRKDIEAGYVKYYAAWLPGIDMDAPVGYRDDSTGNSITVRESYSVPALWTTDKEGKRSFDFIAKMIRDNLPDPPEGQSGAPLALTYPLQVHYTLRLHLPDDWDFGSGALHVRNAAYQFDFIPEYGNRELTLHYTLLTFADHIDARDVRQYAADHRNIDDRVSFTLYKDNSSPDMAPSLEPAGSRHGAGDEQGIHYSRPCWPAIWLSFFYALLFSRLFVWLNGRSAGTVVPAAANRLAPGVAKSLGGWVLVLGFCIGVGFAMDVFQWWRANYYSLDNWNAWTAAGGWGMQWVYLGQLAIQLNFLAGAGAVMYWFLKKRDIFPRMFIGYAAVVLVGRLLLIGMYNSLHLPEELGAYRSDLPWAFVRTGVYAAIWVTYLLRSGQVRNTFLEPFRTKK